MDLSNVHIIVRSFFISLFSIVIFFKITNHKISILKKLILVVISSILYVVFRRNFHIAISLICFCLIQVSLIRIAVRERITNDFFAIIISVALTFIILLISGTIEFLIQAVLKINDNNMNVFITEILSGIIVFFMIRSNRIKYGLSFLKKKNDYIEILVMNVCILIAILSEIMSYYTNAEYIKNWYVLFAILGLSMVYTIYRTINIYYKQKLTDETIEGMKSELNEKDNEIKRLTEENFRVHKVNHEFYNKQKALEKMVRDSMNMESGEELAVLERIKNVSKEHSESMESLKSLDELPHTEIPEIDDMFSYMRQECVDSNIEFILRVKGNIFYMINNLIAKEKLETMIGDHIRDAIIAVNSSDNKNKKIFVSIGKESSIYELCIFDTGIEFEIDTLNRLGLEQVTTHKEEGGTGIGFISTFETMRESKASLEIEEIGKICSDNYTKAVKIIFDGKNEYRIKSYRKDELNGVLNSSRIKLL